MRVTFRKEWTGESGYCNCLLAVMSRVSIRQVELFSDQPPPDLEALDLDPTRWHDCGRRSPFIDAGHTEIIETLARSAGITKSFWRYKPESTGSTQAYDCNEIRNAWPCAAADPARPVACVPLPPPIGLKRRPNTPMEPLRKSSTL